MPAKQRNRRKLSRSPVRRKAAKTASRYLVGRADKLKPGQSSKFLMPIKGVEQECFIINHAGKFHAYVNRCRHVPIAMDWLENQFFTEEGRYLMCQTHGAYYDPDSGECFAGPPIACVKFLFRVPLEIKNGRIFASPPEQDIEAGI